MTDASDICWWNPNSFECQRKAAIEAEPYYPLMYSDGDELRANITYLMAATIPITMTSIMVFRYRSSSIFGDFTKGYYYIWEVTHGSDSLNLPNLAFMILDYGSLGLWGVAWIFQLIAMFGILTDINMIIWDWGIFVGMPVLLSVWLTLMGGAYDAGNMKCRSVAGNGCSEAGQMAGDIVLAMAIAAWAGASIAGEYGPWH
jgi:hypothetical protein